jgi:hypothetical protein
LALEYYSFILLHFAMLEFDIETKFVEILVELLTDLGKIANTPRKGPQQSSYTSESSTELSSSKEFVSIKFILISEGIL